VEEFRNSLDLNTIQWREGHSYGYSQNIPYFPVIDLLFPCLADSRREIPLIRRGRKWKREHRLPCEKEKT